LINHEATKAGVAKEDFWILFSSIQDINSQLACAPLAISLLSTIKFIAIQGSDFILIDKEDVPKFQHLEFPNSFRATISGVNNKARNAFIQANSSMDRIMMTTKEVPKDFQGAMEVMNKGQGYDITKLLPIHLKAISSGAENCKKEAKSVLDSFANVSAILDDLTTVISLKKARSEGTVKKVGQEIKCLKLEAQKIKEDKKRTEDDKRNLTFQPRLVLTKYTCKY
jgi:archaellum component FlaC